MNFELKNSVLTIFFTGRIDSTNADEIEKSANEIISNNSFDELVFDAESLEYISSAGLRMVLKSRKNNPSLKIINASSEVYDIFDMTGFTEMIPVEKAYRKLSVEGCEIIGKGAKGTVYRYDPETIIKVYKDAESLPAIKNERELARKAFVLGIPTAISYDVVKVGNSFGSVFELLNAKSFSALISENPEKLDEYVKIYAEMLKVIHSKQVEKGELSDIKALILKWIETDSPYLDKENAEKMKELVRNVPDVLNVLHCDYHTNNIMMQNDEALLIDMDTLSCGHPIFELANIYITYVGFGEENPSVVESFIGLPYSTAVKIWKKFLPIYLGTNDENKIKDVEDKARILSYARLMRHIVRRGGAETESGRKTIEFCNKNISNLIKNINSLEF